MRILALFVVSVLVGCQAKVVDVCPEEVSLPRALSDKSLHGCTVSLSGYFIPDESTFMYLSTDDALRLNMLSALPIEIDQGRDSRGLFVRMNDGSLFSEVDGARLIKAVGTLEWSREYPILRKVHGLVSRDGRTAK